MERGVFSFLVENGVLVVRVNGRRFRGYCVESGRYFGDLVDVASFEREGVC